MTTRRAAGPLLVILLSSVALAVLDASGQAFWQGLVINLGLFIILTVSLNLTSGFTGVFSLGQIGFMALGAYASAILTLPLQEKAAYLLSTPSLGTVNAVHNVRFVTVPFTSTSPGIRVPALVRQLAVALYPEYFE